MDNNNEIIEFEDLFKEEIRQRNEPPKPQDRRNYGYSIAAYLLIMFVLNFLLLSVFMVMPNAVKTYEKDEIVLESIVTDSSGIALMQTSTFDLYKEEYSAYADSFYIFEGYSIIYNKSNEYIESLLLIKYDGVEITSFNIDAFKSIFADDDSSINYWDSDKKIEITIYQTDEQVLPDFYLTTDVVIINSKGTSLTAFYASLYQFLIYIILFAFLLFFLKNDLAYDFKRFKLVKNQWAVILITGYLYVLLGNYLSSFISKILSGIFNTPISESINQISIIRMLNSNGVIFIVISAVIIGPIVEELIFRKSIFGLIKNPKVALVVSSLVFGAIHLTAEASLAAALVNGVSYFMMGLIFGYIYLKNDKNIMAPIAIHIVANLVSVVASIFFL